MTLAALHGAALPAHIASLTKGTQTMMKLAILKPAIAAAVAVLLLAGAGSLAVSHSFAAPRPAPMADAVTADAMPEAAKGFLGQIRGTVAAKGDGTIILSITEIVKTGKNSKATDASALVGKKIPITPNTVPMHNDMILAFFKTLTVGDSIAIWVSHKEGDALMLIELTQEQRQKLPKK